MIASAGFFLLSCYIAINAHMVVFYRADRFKQNQSLECYWAFWVDWFTFFWIDLIMNLTFVEK